MFEAAGLFLAGFLSATLLPGSSEAALVLALAGETTDRTTIIAIAAATTGNTLGSCVNWAIGRFLGRLREHPRFPVSAATFERYAAWYGRWGVWSLLLSWAPVIGDPLTVIAGMFRTPLVIFVPVVAAAKLARYLVVAGAVELVIG